MKSRRRAIKSKNKRPQNTRKRRGGEAIAHGGFGCVFYKGLKCKGGKVVNNTITKLMTIHQATREYNNITKFEGLLKDIPHYTHYFLLYGFSLCEPDDLSREDMIGFDTHCTYLKRYKITSANVNNTLSKLRVIRMPYGGLEIYDYVEHVKLQYEKMLLLNTTLLSLFTDGILKMNNRNVYHCDIKGSNVLVDDLDAGKLYTRLIDWGMSVHITSEKIPPILQNKSIQYNMPFSAILFTNDFITMYATAFSLGGLFDLEPFVHRYVLYWVQSRGVGHISTINRIFKQIHLTEPMDKMKHFSTEVLKYKYAYYYVFKYITDVLRKYSVDGKFEMQKYFVNIFLKNVDVWGFIMIYYDVLKCYNSSTDYDKKITNTIKLLIMLVVENGAELIDREKLKQLIIKLNGLINLPPTPTLPSMYRLPSMSRLP